MVEAGLKPITHDPVAEAGYRLIATWQQACAIDDEWIETPNGAAKNPRLRKYYDTLQDLIGVTEEIIAIKKADSVVGAMFQIAVAMEHAETIYQHVDDEYRGYCGKYHRLIQCALYSALDVLAAATGKSYADLFCGHYADPEFSPHNILQKVEASDLSPEASA